MASKYPVKIKAAPKVGALYWCTLHAEAQIHIPEFWKKRPVVVISRKNTLNGKVTVLPITTDEDNASYEHSIELSQATRDKINGKRSWIVCDHIMTVATSRLDFIHKRPPRIDQAELAPILEKAHSLLAGWMPPQVTTVAVVETTTVIATADETIATFTDGVTLTVERKTEPSDE